MSVNYLNKGKDLWTVIKFLNKLPTIDSREVPKHKSKYWIKFTQENLVLLWVDLPDVSTTAQSGTCLHEGVIWVRNRVTKYRHRWLIFTTNTLLTEKNFICCWGNRCFKYLNTILYFQRYFDSICRQIDRSVANFMEITRYFYLVKWAINLKRWKYSNKNLSQLLALKLLSEVPFFFTCVHCNGTLKV